MKTHFNKRLAGVSLFAFIAVLPLSEQYAFAAEACNIVFNSPRVSSEVANYFENLLRKTYSKLGSESELGIAFLQLLKEYDPKNDKYAQQFGLFFDEVFRNNGYKGTPLSVILKYFKEDRMVINFPLDMEHLSEQEALGKLFQSGYPLLSDQDIQSILNTGTEVPFETALFNPKIVQALKDYYAKSSSISPLVNINDHHYAEFVTNVINRLHAQGIVVWDVWKGMLNNSHWINAGDEARLHVFNAVHNRYWELNGYKEKILDYKLADGTTPMMQALMIGDRGLFHGFYKAGANLDAKFPSDDPNGNWRKGDTIREVADRVFPHILSISDIKK